MSRDAGPDAPIRLRRKQVEDILTRTGALLEGHFVLASGLHSPRYLEKFRVLEHPEETSVLCGMIADHFRDQRVAIVAGPTTGGVIVSYEVARHLGVRSIFAETEGDRRVFRRGFEIAPGQRILVVDDILTTGGSVRQVVDEVRRLGGEVLGVGVLVDRSGGKVDLGASLFSCHRMELPTYRPEECPLCQGGQPITQPGSSSLRQSQD